MGPNGAMLSGMGGADQKTKEALPRAGRKITAGAGLLWLVLAATEGAVQSVIGDPVMKDIIFSPWVIAGLIGALLATWGPMAAFWLRDRFRGAGGQARFALPVGVAMGLRPDPTGMRVIAYPKVESISARNLYVRVLGWDWEIEGVRSSVGEVFVPNPLIRHQRDQIETPAIVLPTLTGVSIGKALTGWVHMALEFGLTESSSAGAIYFRYRIRMPEIATHADLRIGNFSEIVQEEFRYARLERVRHGTPRAMMTELEQARQELMPR